MAGLDGVHHMKPKALCSCAALGALIIAGPVAAQDSKPNLSQIPDFMSRPLAQRALQWVCTPSVRYVCFAEAGCSQISHTGSVHLDLAKKIYARCGSPELKNCVTFPLRFEAQGAFTYVDEPISGTTFLEVLNDGSQYVEVVAGYHSERISGFSVLQNFGSCKPRR